ncbi:MAG: hypothetical protein FWG07_00295 [Treponema sp.]|nr:hypothetical protein [Treponema sp.]
MKPAAASTVPANGSTAGGGDAGNPAMSVKQVALNKQLTQIKATAAVSGTTGASLTEQRHFAMKMRKTFFVIFTAKNCRLPFFWEATELTIRFP